VTEGFGIERLPPALPGVSVARTGRDQRSPARQRAFEQALRQRPKPAAAPEPAAPGGEAGDGSGVRVGGDGLPHVDVVV